MNKRTAPALLGVLALGLLLNACTTFEGNAYKVIGTTTTAVEAARKAWVDYVTKQRVVLATNQAELTKLETNVAKVQVVYGQYQVAMQAAHDAVIYYKTHQGTEDSVTLALNTVSASGGSLVALINSLIGGK